MDNFNEIFKQLFGDYAGKTLEELEEENRQYELKMIEENPPLIMSFAKFAKGKFEEGHRNLYIVWRGKQALYVGISKSNIWNRWFLGSRSHILINAGGHWISGFSSPIGRAIIYNRPASMRWKIELRYIPISQDLHAEETKLIHELHPIFNSTYLPSLTEKEKRIYEQLTKKETDYILNSRFSPPV